MRKIYSFEVSLNDSVDNFPEQHIMQGHHFSLLQHETEKLRNDIEKMRSELRSDLYSYCAIDFCLLPCEYFVCSFCIFIVQKHECDAGMKSTKSLLGSGWI